jgi:hypothetical protein
MDSISMSLEFFVYVLYGCGKQFEVAVSLSHDIMSFDSTSDPDPKISAK